MYSFVTCYRDGKVWVSLGSDFHVETGTANVPIDIGMSPPAPSLVDPMIRQDRSAAPWSGPIFFKWMSAPSIAWHPFALIMG